MANPYITLGSPTTGGGKIISGQSSFLIEGKAIACVGDKASCPKHKCVATIVAGDNHMLVMGKAAAQHNSPLSCGCKCIGDQNLTVGDNGGGLGIFSKTESSTAITNGFTSTNSKQYGHQFQLKDELTDEPLANICYEVIKNGEVIHGITDENGFTELIIDKNEIEVEINILNKGSEDGRLHCCKR
ncbi:PAAR domain-containing protein [Acinetobacter bereziniae]|uniref:PAAR domain-containing protein n=1 Tax=Acinetobacter bereziniae TaxID=106648 RepID=UPI00111753AE|nr:PAAR domain-containing protein [Acinetobacter bereziniae]TNL49058.1 PAAR domain-containing protein [Acinetobacter bereziniae]TNL58987.1 PAAR domain-containing protein [Acinetobacter bereziniae]